MTNNDYHKTWREQNKEHFNGYQRAYKAKRRAEDPELRKKQNAASLAYYRRKKAQLAELQAKIAEMEAGKED